MYYQTFYIILIFGTIVIVTFILNRYNFNKLLRTNLNTKYEWYINLSNLLYVDISWFGLFLIECYFILKTLSYYTANPILIQYTTYFSIIVFDFSTFVPFYTFIILNKEHKKVLKILAIEIQNVINSNSKKIIVYFHDS
uniref:Serpentine receptor class gamma n=1 Tax=Strongyloides papillosus TaxID=174720 RepID=A0A0N5CB99_STREA